MVVAGFLSSAAAAKSILARGIGPGLAEFGLTSVIAHPVLSLYSGSALDGSNQELGRKRAALQAAFAQTGAFNLSPAAADSALLATLPAGSYTAQISGGSRATPWRKFTTSIPIRPRPRA